ncbi:leucine-rich repeat-containing protein 74B [Lingula anatina]|uniref:Leucine-rich repeat-containing protein 74B n=1 Tax=Lingula anatina TaxID=7574 RepID=A0A1S3H7Y8_LINAN|nr:leucine-rich repeat-containing protein 74B [Lingula anatina]|eukprot:XP_013382113.1 leucine-rich repeat-containing protein 74B [Lingula anatina]
MAAAVAAKHQAYRSLRELPVNVYFGDDEQYDTDLDTEHVLAEQEIPKVDDSYIGASRYTAACKFHEIIPQSKILDSLPGTVINIRNRTLGSKHIKALAEALKKNTTVQVLILEGNTMEGEGIQEVCEMLTENDFITEVNLSRNRLGSRHSLLNGPYYISDMMRKNNTLTHLDLSYNDLTENDAMFIAFGMEGNFRISHLNLSHNDFEEGGAQYIGKALMENRSIETLNLSWNHIRRKGAVIIARALQSNKNLTHVDLSWNGFGYEGALALGQALKRNKYMKELDITNNRINWAGAQFLANGIKKNETLETLRIGLNPISTTGALDILEAVAKDKCNITLLDMKGVPVIGEFDFMSSTLKQSRPGFRCIHGAIVLFPDPLGERLAKPVDPMRKVIEMMTKHKLRPLEMFKNFDKEGLFMMGHGGFKNKLKDEMKKNEMFLTRGELQEVINLMENKAGSEFGEEGNLNFVKLSQGVKEQKRQERMEKSKAAAKKKKLRDYHDKILGAEEPDLPPESPPPPELRPMSAGLPDRGYSPKTTRSGSKPIIGSSTPRMFSLPRPPVKILSMSDPLGVKKGKKKKKK